MNFEQLERILDEALSKTDAAERESYLSAVCQGDAKLRAELDRLLRASESCGNFLDDPVTCAYDQPVGETVGQTIGRYKLLDQIGEGGFGLVFLAEQTQPICR